MVLLAEGDLALFRSKRKICLPGDWIDSTTVQAGEDQQKHIWAALPKGMSDVHIAALRRVGIALLWTV